MDTLYYSNFCKHSQRVLQFLVKGNLVDKLNFLCVDKREKDPHNNQIYLVLEDGKKVVLPPNVQSVPTLLLVRQGYRVILGEDIIEYFQGDANRETKRKQLERVVEPVGTSLGSAAANIFSEPYTSYDLTPQELSAKGTSARRPMHNYVSANEEIIGIYTPPDNYQPDKVTADVTVDSLQQKRMDEIDTNKGGMSAFPSSI